MTDTPSEQNPEQAVERTQEQAPVPAPDPGRVWSIECLEWADLANGGGIVSLNLRGEGRPNAVDDAAAERKAILKGVLRSAIRASMRQWPGWSRYAALDAQARAARAKLRDLRRDLKHAEIDLAGLMEADPPPPDLGALLVEAERRVSALQPQVQGAEAEAAALGGPADKAGRAAFDQRSGLERAGAASIRQTLAEERARYVVEVRATVSRVLGPLLDRLQVIDLLTQQVTADWANIVGTNLHLDPHKYLPGIEQPPVPGEGPTPEATEPAVEAPADAEVTGTDAAGQAEPTPAAEEGPPSLFQNTGVVVPPVRGRKGALRRAEAGV